MSAKPPEDILEDNIRRLIGASAARPRPGFQRQLVQAVLEEARKERRTRWARRIRRTGWAIGAAAAAIVIAAVIVPRLWPATKTPALAQTVGNVKTLYGLVSTSNGQPPQTVDQVKDIRAGQWVRTHTGSRAEIVLMDRSRLLVQPRTSVKMGDKTQGQKVVLANGVLGIQAATQKPGDTLTIETPGAQISVLGTSLEVHVVDKPDGRKQTRVSVTAGTVELASGGGKVLLPANTEGVAERGRRPTVRSLTAEVNEMVRLVEKTRQLTAESGARAGTPAIVEFNGDVSATVWAIVSIANATAQPLNRYSLSCTLPVGGIEAFSLQGTRLPVAATVNAWQVDLSDDPVSPGGNRDVIIKATGLKGLFQAKGSGTFEFRTPQGDSAALSLLQFRLPPSAVVESITPTPAETRRTLSRLVLTVSARGQLLPLVK